MTVFEKAAETVKENVISADEIYLGIGFLAYAEIITQSEYKTLVSIFKKNHPEYF